MNKNLNQIVSLVRDLQELDRLVDGFLKKKNPKEHKDGRKDNHRPTELEKKLNQLKQLVAAMIALLTKRPKNKDEEVLMKAKFKSLAKEMMSLLSEIEALLKEMEKSRAIGRRVYELGWFIQAKRAQYERAA
jgi:DNA mismatch repair ATPase MutS